MTTYARALLPLTPESADCPPRRTGQLRLGDREPRSRGKRKSDQLEEAVQRPYAFPRHAQSLAAVEPTQCLEPYLLLGKLPLLSLIRMQACRDVNSGNLRSGQHDQCERA